MALRAEVCNIFVTFGKYMGNYQINDADNLWNSPLILKVKNKNMLLVAEGPNLMSSLESGTKKLKKLFY